MPIVGSGQVSFSDLRTEFVGGTGAVSLSDYYQGGSNVYTGVKGGSGIPTSGAVSLSDYYSSENLVELSSAGFGGIYRSYTGQHSMSGYTNLLTTFNDGNYHIIQSGANSAYTLRSWSGNTLPTGCKITDLSVGVDCRWDGNGATANCKIYAAGYGVDSTNYQMVQLPNSGQFSTRTASGDSTAWGVTDAQIVNALNENTDGGPGISIQTYIALYTGISDHDYEYVAASVSYKHPTV